MRLNTLRMLSIRTHALVDTLGLRSMKQRIILLTLVILSTYHLARASLIAGCEDDEQGLIGYWSTDCVYIDTHVHVCDGRYDDNGWVASTMCCACGGGNRVPTCEDDTLRIDSTIFRAGLSSSLTVDLALPDYQQLLTWDDSAATSSLGFTPDQCNGLEWTVTSRSTTNLTHFETIGGYRCEREG